MNFQERLNALIPGGAHTYSRGFDQFPSNAPQILDRGKDAYVWDPDGKKYLDYGMALRAVTLGYANERVNAAAWRQIEKGNNLTRASVVELEAAEVMTSLIPGANMVKFAKNGSNATTGAAKIARAYTGRKYICVPRQQPFFSFDDWFIGTTAMKRGIPESHAATTLVFDYNDIGSLQRLFDEHRGQIAAVLTEPATHLVPCGPNCAHQMTYRDPCMTCINTGQNFLHQVQKLCRTNGSLFILDEMITGFRWHLQGAQTYFGVEPDMSTFGKGMANGFSVAAILGKSEVMQVGGITNTNSERTFLLSTTHGGEMCSLGAFIETVKIYRETDACAHFWDYGRKLADGLTAVAKEKGVEDYFQLEGPAACLVYATKDREKKVSLELRTLFSQEMVNGGVLMPWIAVSAAHGERELEITLEAARRALEIYARALEDGVDKYLKGDAVKPVFRRYN